MQLIDKITNAQVYEYNDGYSSDFLLVHAEGEVSTSGWSRFRLVPRYYVNPPKDGIWDFDVIGDQPSGNVLQVILSVSAFDVFLKPNWAIGVRIHSVSNDMTAAIVKSAAAVVGFTLSTPLYRRDLAQFDDSIQPTGTIHWSGITPHVEMKKLHHTLTLVIEGPDQNDMDRCFHQAATAAVIAAIVAAYATGGLGLSAAVDAFIGALTACLGANYSVRVDNHANWVYWDT
jgi:hypothetical protein